MSDPTPEQLRELAKSLDWWAGDSRTELKEAAHHLRTYAERLAHHAAAPIPAGFSSGVASMARNTLPVVTLLRTQRWSLDDAERWLIAVINSDAHYLATLLKDLPPS